MFKSHAINSSQDYTKPCERSEAQCSKLKKLGRRKLFNTYFWENVKEDKEPCSQVPALSVAQQAGFKLIADHAAECIVY